jgi:histone deacetylase 1/2
VAGQEAMRQEYASLKKNNTFTPVPQCDANSEPIDCKWVYKTKNNPNGTLRCKARLVIKGYKQVEGVNFDETYVPVGNMSTLPYLLGFVAHDQGKMDHLDVVTAFLNPKIDAEVYMEEPDGIEWLEQKLSTDGIEWLEPDNPTEPPNSEQYILRLNKALYGLRQAPRLWHKAIDGFLLSIGFH